MSYLKKALSAASIAILIGTGTIVTTTGIASAHVACNADGDCWHTDKSYRYRPDMKVEVHPDSWYFRQDWTNRKDLRYREHHDDRGYYRDGVWVPF